MKMKLTYLAVLSIVLISGCSPKEQECKPVFIPQKFKHNKVVEPKWSDENTTDEVAYLRAKLENSPKHKSYEYDLKAELERAE